MKLIYYLKRGSFAMNVMKSGLCVSVVVLWILPMGLQASSHHSNYRNYQVREQMASKIPTNTDLDSDTTSGNVVSNNQISGSKGLEEPYATAQSDPKAGTEKQAYAINLGHKER
jgi:hypothetical protein